VVKIDGLNIKLYNDIQQIHNTKVANGTRSPDLINMGTLAKYNNTAVMSFRSPTVDCHNREVVVIILMQFADRRYSSYKECGIKKTKLLFFKGAGE